MCLCVCVCVCVCGGGVVLPWHCATLQMGTLHKDEYWSSILMVLNETQVTPGTFCLPEWFQQDCCKEGGRGLEFATCKTALAEVSVNTFYHCSAGHRKWGGNWWHQSCHTSVSSLLPNVLYAWIAVVCCCTLHSNHWLFGCITSTHP